MESPESGLPVYGPGSGDTVGASQAIAITTIPLASTVATTRGQPLERIAHLQPRPHDAAGGALRRRRDAAVSHGIAAERDPPGRVRERAHGDRDVERGRDRAVAAPWVDVRRSHDERAADGDSNEGTRGWRALETNEEIDRRHAA